MKRTLLLLLCLVCALALVLAGCGQADQEETADENTEESTEEAAAGDYTLSIGHVLQTDSTYHLAASKFAELVEEYTDGHVTVTVYPAGQLGNEREMYEAVQIGTLDACYCAVSTLPAWVPEFQICDLPFIFDSYEHEFACFDGELGDYLNAKLEEIGLINCGYGETGWANFIYNGDEIHNYADCAGRTFRTKENEVDQTYNAFLKVNPVAMSWGEIFTALQTGTVDGGHFPMNSLVASQFHTVVDYITILNDTDIPTTLCVSKASLEKLPEEYQEAVLKAGKDACLYKRTIIEEWDEKALQTMKDAGVTVIEADRDEWKDYVVENYWPQVVGSVIPQELVDMVDQYR